MGFNWLAFAGGAAEAGTKFIEEQRRTAAARSEAQVKQMLVDYSAKKKKSEQTIEEYSKNVEIIRSAFPDATEEQLVDIAHNPLVMDKVVDSVKAGTFDPNIVDLSGIKKVTKDNDPKTAAEIIADMYDLDTTPKPQAAAAPKKQGGISGFIKRIGQSEAEDAAESLASVAGLSVDQLRAAQDYSPTPYTSKSKLNMEAVAELGMTFDNRMDKAMMAVADARERVMSYGTQDTPESRKASNDFKRAVNKLGALSYAKSINETKNKTEAQIQSDLITQIQNAKDPEEAKYLTAKLRHRQQLQKAETGTGIDAKTKAASFSNAVVDSFKTRIAAMGIKGAFTTDADGNPVITSLVQDDLNRQIYEQAQKSVIEDNVDEFGKPKSMGHLLGLQRIGVKINSSGVAVPYMPPKVTLGGTSTVNPATRTGQANTTQSRQGKAVGGSNVVKSVNY